MTMDDGRGPAGAASAGGVRLRRRSLRCSVTRPRPVRRRSIPVRSGARGFTLIEAMVAAGQFRQDLYYRINVVKIELPSLRERASDIPVLAEHFARELSKEHDKRIAGFSPGAIDALKRYPYPGNVRELRNIVIRLTTRYGGQHGRREIARRAAQRDDDLPAHVTYDPSKGPPPDSLAILGGLARPPQSAASDDQSPWVPTALEVALEEPEKRILLKALRANNWNQQSTADQLQINRTTLYKKIKQYGLEQLAN